MVFNFCCNPHAIGRRMVVSVAEDEDNFLSDINSITSEHRLDDRMFRVKVIYDKFKRKAFLLVHFLVRDTQDIPLALDGPE